MNFYLLANLLAVSSVRDGAWFEVGEQRSVKASSCPTGDGESPPVSVDGGRNGWMGAMMRLLRARRARVFPPFSFLSFFLSFSH